MKNLFPELKNNKWFYFAVLLVCFAISVGVRGQQFEKWKKTPSNFFVQDRPIMTTLDAPYWLRWAREYNEGVLWQKDHLREYPRATKTYQDMGDIGHGVPVKYKDHPAASSVSLASYFSYSETLATKYSDVPLLSFLIAIFAPYFNYNYYLTGTLLVPILASLFILPLGVYFFRIGVPLPGLLGGLVGTFSGAYYMRSSIGRIDTDMLNLFFPVLAALLILFVSQAKTERSALLYSIATGLSLFLFQWWYAKAGFAFAYFAILVVILFIQKFRLRIILLCSLLFVLCVHPAHFTQGTESIKKIL
jgi:undecaprenyl-diphosphooligosaccharide--protein glycosyltransferase